MKNKKVIVRFIDIIACLLLFTVISFPTLTIAQDIRVYDEHYDLKYRVEEDRVYDKDWNLRYRIEDNKIGESYNRYNIFNLQTRRQKLVVNRGFINLVWDAHLSFLEFSQSINPYVTPSSSENFLETIWQLLSPISPESSFILRKSDALGLIFTS